MSNQAVIDQLEAAVLTHAPDSRLIANVRAVDIHAMIVELRALRKLRDAVKSADFQACSGRKGIGWWEVGWEEGSLISEALREAQQHGGTDA